MDIAIPQKYEYESLCAPDAVRVLVLHPTLISSEPLRCDLIQYSRSELFSSPSRNCQHYTAISYAWGEPEFSRTLLCDGDRFVLRITPNVETILRQLRSKSKLQYLWIDSISLNQADENEKASQIPLMGDIFGQARKVRIWVGTGDDSESNALLFTFLRAVSTIKTESDGAIPRINNYANMIFGETSLTPIIKFFNNQFFFRRWVLQEVKLASQSNVHYGTESMPWPCLALACTVLNKAARLRSHHFNLEEKAVAAINTVATLSSLSETDLLNYLWDFHASKCRDTRDQIFSLYGIIPKKDQISIPGIYDAPLEDVFRIHTLKHLGDVYRILQHLSVFGSVAARTGKDLSWVPDWSGPKRHSLLINKWPDSLSNGEELFRIMKPDRWDKQRTITLRFKSYLLVQDSILKADRTLTDWRSLMLLLRSWRTTFPPEWSTLAVANFESFPEPYNHRKATNKGTFARLVAMMLQDVEHSDSINQIMKNYNATKKGGSNLDWHLQDIWDRILDFERFEWDVSHLHLLEALRKLLESYTLFCQVIGEAEFNNVQLIMGFGPLSMQKGDMISWLWVRTRKNDALTWSRGGQPVNNLRPISVAVLRLEDPDRFDVHVDKLKTVKARLLGFSAVCPGSNLPAILSHLCTRDIQNCLCKSVFCTLL